MLMVKKLVRYLPQFAVECMFFVTIIIVLAVNSNVVGIS